MYNLSSDRIVEHIFVILFPGLDFNSYIGFIVVSGLL